jgi:hypothetical protein
MRILFLNGSFSWDGKNYDNGMICLCHVHMEDNEQTIIEATKRIISRRKEKSQKIILVPFSGLDSREKTMDCESAGTLLNKLKRRVPNVVSVPFGFDNLCLNTTDRSVGFNEI